YTDGDGDRCVVITDDDVDVALEDFKAGVPGVFTVSAPAAVAAPPPPPPAAPASPAVPAIVKEVFDNISSAVEHVQRVAAESRERRSAPAASPPASAQATWHRRHTCDGCGTFPIYGARFKATELHDFDLCTDCHVKTTPKEPAAKPVLTFKRIEGSPVPDAGPCGGRGGFWGRKKGRGRHQFHGGPYGQHHGPRPHGGPHGHPHAPPPHAGGPPPVPGGYGFMGRSTLNAPSVFSPAESTVEQLVEEAIK
ncbi:hypothetical protein TeGR_g11886, partial [Tetraparma gracilis]